MQIVHDNFIVLVDNKYKSEATESGVIPLNEAYMEDWAEEHLKHRKQYGIVMAKPLNYSDSVVDIITPGSPEPRLYISGDYIEALQKAGYTRLPQYNVSTIEKFPQITMADIGKTVTVNVGDKIYFDYLALEPDNYLGPHPKGQLFKIQVDQIFFVVQNNEVISQGGWAAVIPNMETWDDITTELGIIKKPKPEAIYLEGFVKYISKRDDVKPGDKIIYQRNADYKMDIEGLQCYVMRENDILCII